MIFSSLEFIIFFLIFVFLIFKSNKYQQLLIIISSIFFYAFWEISYVLLLAYIIITLYLSLRKKIRLFFSITILLLPLIFFKYSHFLIEVFNVEYLSKFAHSKNLPLGISFITFTAIALLVDSKKRVFDEDLNFKSLTEFIVYFPQLIAGPILRANELIPLLKKKIIFKKENIKFGLLLFLIGFIKKIFFADTIGELIDPIFANPKSFSNDFLLMGAFLFPAQIYFDFSGYVDMALGISKILNIELPINFNKPYLASSLTDFWRRWHITLGKWFKDYLYIPLGGSKKGKLINFLTLFTTMTVAGLWHGASWNFIIWGGINGTILYLEKLLSPLNLKLPKIVKIFFTCLIIFNLWIVFRVTDLNNLLFYFESLYFENVNFFNINSILPFVILILCVFLQKIDNYYSAEKYSSKINFKIFLPIFVIIIFTGLLLNTGSSDKFIYFDF